MGLSKSNTTVKFYEITQVQYDCKYPVSPMSTNRPVPKKVTFKTVKLHSKRVEKISNYTRNEWRRFRITLEKSGEDFKLHSKRVVKI